MSHLFFTDKGKLYRREIGSDERAEMTLPNGVYQRTPLSKPDMILFDGSIIVVGQFNVGLIWTKRRKLRKLGIEAGTTAPTLATNSTGITGEAIGVYTFAEIDLDGTIIHESNPSPVSNTLTLTNQGRAWSGLPTTHTNERVNYLRLYVSMDGDDFQFVANHAIGTATVNEAVATNSRGDAVNEFRGVPPEDAIMVAKYARRAWYVSARSKSIYYSELDEPESVDEDSFLNTLDARYVTCIKGLESTLVVGTRVSVQQNQAFIEDDFGLFMVTEDVGIVNQRSATVANGKLWFFGQDGYYRFAGGQPEYMSPQLRTYLRDAYEADPIVWEQIEAITDKRKHTIHVLVPGDSAVSRAAARFRIHYLPTEPAFGGSGELPDWSFDDRDAGRYDTCLGRLTSGNLFDEPVTGSSDGHVRRDDIASIASDDGLAYETVIVPKHFLMGAQDGDDQKALTFKSLDVFVKSEQTDYEVSLYVGDDDAYSALTPQFGPETVAASGLTVGNQTAASLPRRSATRAWSRLIVGSSPN